MFFDFKITSGIWLYISAVFLTSICQSFSRIESLCKPMVIILPMQYEAIFTKNIDCCYMLEPPP